MREAYIELAILISIVFATIFGIGAYAKTRADLRVAVATERIAAATEAPKTEIYHFYFLCKSVPKMGEMISDWIRKHPGECGSIGMHVEGNE